MSIRLRLALWCALLCNLIMVITALLSYALHVRGHYDSLDTVLATSAVHAQTELSRQESPASVGESGSFEVVLYLYNGAAQLQDKSDNVEKLPVPDPRVLLSTSSSPAYDPVAGLVPSLATLPPGYTEGVFGTFTNADQRWRVYTLPLRQPSSTFISGYLVALTPLGRLDASIQTFRLVLLTLGLVSVVVAFVGGRLVAGQTLRPVGEMTRTAQTIALSQDLSHRIEVPPHQDELGQLAVTFNKMLESLQAASRTQQRFVSDASHELRAPLTAIQGNLELLHRHPDMPQAERDEALVEAERETARLGRLVADLLALARADAGVALKSQPLDLDLVVLAAFQEARRIARKGQKLILDPFEPARIEGDEDRLKQVLLILLDNAIKYTPEDGSITLGLRYEDSHNKVELLVQDSGIGIAPADLPHVFERFYRADPGRGRDPGGTGLGLPIAQWIVEQHGGEIELKSQPGQGTRVLVYLPLLGSQPASKALGHAE